VALSNLTIVGGALANFAFNVNRRHPSGDKPLIDWDLIMVMEPTTILGALLGSYINKVRNVLKLKPVLMRSTHAEKNSCAARKVVRDVSCMASVRNGLSRRAAECL